MNPPRTSGSCPGREVDGCLVWQGGWGFPAMRVCAGSESNSCMRWKKEELEAYYEKSNHFPGAGESRNAD